MPLPGLPRFRKLGAGRVLLHPSRDSLKYRKVGEGKLPASFPSPPEKARGAVWYGEMRVVVRAVPPRSLDLRMRRTAKEVGGGGGRKPRRLRWFLPPQRRLKEYCFCCVENLDLFRLLLVCTFSWSLRCRMWGVKPRGAPRSRLLLASRAVQALPSFDMKTPPFRIPINFTRPSPARACALHIL